MEDQNKPDPELLRRMMMGDFSASFSDKNNAKTNLPKKGGKLEIDLHFEKLFPKLGHLSPSEKKEKQIAALHTFIADSRKTSKKHGYVIVGKGDGVLKKEVLLQLKHKNIPASVVNDPPYFGNAIKLQL